MGVLYSDSDTRIVYIVRYDLHNEVFMTYEILSAVSEVALRGEVNSNLDRGWKLHGTLIIVFSPKNDSLAFFQAMVKP